MYLSSDDDLYENCQCGHGYALPESGLCFACTDNWISDNSIGQQLEEDGFRDGFEVAVTDAVNDTRYGRARDDYIPSSFICVPDYAEVDPDSYIDGYQDGYLKGYNCTYNRHHLVLQELRHRHIRYWTRLRFLASVSHHPLLDLNLLDTINKLSST